MGLFPVFFKLDGRRCLVAGAGEVAASKIESLVEAGARVRVVAPWAKPAVAALAEAGRVEWYARPVSVDDLDGVFLAVAATNVPAVNHDLYEAATARGVICNAVDDPPYCDFYFGSVLRRGDLQIAISTAGQSPALAQRLRRELEAQLPADLGPWLAALGELRREVLLAHPPGEARKLLLHELAHREVCRAADCPARSVALAASEGAV